MTDFNNCIYIASCVFTKEYPELSFKIQDYLKRRFNMRIIRCCVEKYKVREFEESMPECAKEKWRELPHYTPFMAVDVIVSVCHNCSAIFEETLPQTKVLSLWELILSDAEFPFPDYRGEQITLQDCWRSYDNRAEQEAVRALLQKMNIEIVELDNNFEKTDFCGISLYAPSPTRNLKMAPKRFVENAQGKFVPHSEEEQHALMREYCQKITTDKVVAYCHYCTKGLKIGGKQTEHLGSLLFNQK